MFTMMYLALNGNKCLLGLVNCSKRVGSKTDVDWINRENESNS